MKHLKTASIPAALGAMVLASALSAQGSTTTNDWFTAAISGLDAAPWSKPAGDASVIESGNISLDTKGELLTYTPATATPVGTNAFVDASIQFVAAESDPDLPSGVHAKASLAVRKGVISGVETLYYIARSGSSWIRMYGAAPDLTDFVDVRAELDFSSPQAPKARYFVDGVVLTDAESGGDEWVALAAETSGSDNLSTIGFSGTGFIEALSGKYYYEVASAYLVAVDGVDKPIVLTDTWLAAHNLTGASDSAVNAALADIGDNGLPKWKSYVLGLESETSHIWVENVANNDPTKMTIKLSGPAATLPDSGITVQYRLQKRASLSDNWATATNASNEAIPDQDEPSFMITLPDAQAVVGYYRIIAVFSAN